jgi:flavin-dependent dehydrogenase
MRAGAEVRFEVTVTGLLRDADGIVVGVEARGADGRKLRARAPITIGADGIRSRVAREVGALSYGRAANASGMVAGYWSGLEVDGYQWFYGHGEGAGLIPTNDGLVCAWVATRSDRFLAEQRQRPDHGFHELFRHVAPDWAEALGDAEQVEPLRGFAGVHGYLRQPWGRGWALVGDASHFKDPLSTHGMTDALRDAELLARAVLVAASGSTTYERALADYHDTRDALARPLHELADQAASYAWSLDELRTLLVDLSAAMRPGVQHQLALDTAAITS